MITIQRLRPLLVVALTFATLFMVFQNLLRPETPLLLNAMSVLLGALIIAGLFGLNHLEEIWRKQAQELRVISEEKVRLYTQKSQYADQLSTLNTVVGLLTESLSPNEVLDVIASSASLVSDANAVAVYAIRDESVGNWQLVRQAGFKEDLGDSLPKPLLSERLALGQLDTLTIPDILRDTRTSTLDQAFISEDKRAMLELPIVRGSHVEGVVGLYFNQARTFSDEYLNIVKSFVTQIANSLHNARIYETTDTALGITTENLKAILDARETYTQMIVHDLRSPLTAVTTSLKLLTELVPKDSDFYPLVERTTDISRRALRKVLARVDAMLDVAKMESGAIYLSREAVNLATIVESVRSELAPIAQELEITFNTQISDKLPLINVDADKIERMVLNLIDNALKYAPVESEVVIRASVLNASEVRLDVSDRGQGIPDEYKIRLFDRFLQVEGRQVVRSGVGLGLSFCKLVIEAHGGKIWIEDNPGGGSMFSVTLPIATAVTPVDYKNSGVD